jgi:acyl carrier protein
MNTLTTLQDLLIKQHALTREALAPEAELASLGVDSLGLIELLFHIEDQFGIDLPDDKLPVLATIGSVVEYIDRLRSLQGDASGTTARPGASPDE